MASLKELLAKAKGKLERIPEIAKEKFSDSKEAVADYFEPQPIEDGVRIRDFLREVPSNTGEMAKDILQGTARSFDFVGRQLTPWEEDISPKPDKINQTMEKLLFGGADKRAKTLSDVGEIEVGLDREKNPILTPLAGLGIVGLDFIPGGQGKSKGFKQWIKSLTDETVETLAKTSDRGIIEQTVRESAPALKDSEVTRLVDDLVNSKTADEVKGIADMGNLDTYRAGKAVETAKESQKTASKISKADALEDVVVFRDTKGQYRSVPASRFTDADRARVGDGFFGDEVARVKPNGKVETAKIAKADTPTVRRETAKRGADETVTIYRGQNQPEFSLDANRSKVNNMQGTSFSREQGMAEAYSRSGTGGGKQPTIVTATIPESKIMKFGDLPKAEQTAVQKEIDALSDDEIVSGELVENIMDRMVAFANLMGKEAIDVETFTRGIVPEVRVLDDAKSFAVQMINDSAPALQKKTQKALEAAEKETKKLSSRRLQDAKKYGISEDVMGRMLYAKAGGRMSNVEAKELADSINAPLKDLLTKSPDSFKVDTPQLQAYAQEVEGYFENVVKDLKAQSEMFPQNKDLRDAYKEASRTHIKARSTLEAVISEAGRLAQSSIMFGKYSRLPGMDGKIKRVRDQIVKFSEKNPKHAELPTEFDMALETVDLNDTTQMLDFLTQWNRSSFLQKLSEFQKASLLSALSTHAVNALGNAIQQVLDIPVRALAGGLDAGKSAITGAERTVYAGESLAQVRGAFKSFPSAFSRAAKALGNEHYAQELRRTEIEAGTVVPAIRGKFGKVVRLPFRLLQMADLGFRTVKKGAEGEALATRIAKKEGLKGKEFKARVKELSDNLPEDMLDLVDERVERSLMLEEVEGLLKSVEDLKNTYPALQFVIPFYRTLVNLSREAYRMTPIGGIGRTVGRITPGQTGRNIERAFSNKWTMDDNTKMEELSRQIMGTTIMAWVVTNMLNGDVEITGPAPSSAGDREVFYGQGKLPHSIRYGDKWVEFQRVQPIGQLLQVGASISEAIQAYKNTGELASEEVEKEMMNSIGDIMSMVFTQSPFTGAADLFALLTGGEYNEGYFEAGNRYLGQLAGTFIPNILRRATVAQDPILYEKRDVSSQLKSRVPGLAQTLTPKRDIFGETIRQGGTPMSRFASPIRTSESIENKLYDEMAEIKYTPTVPTRQAYNEDLSVKEYETLQLFYGPRFRDEMWAVVNDDAYKTLNDEQKRDVISGVSKKVLNFSRQTLFPVYLEKNQLRKQWEQDGYTPAVIEDALNAKFPYDKDTLEVYAENILQENLQQGEARQTIEDLLQSQ